MSGSQDPASLNIRNLSTPSSDETGYKPFISQGNDISLEELNPDSEKFFSQVAKQAKNLFGEHRDKVGSLTHIIENTNSIDNPLYIANILLQQEPEIKNKHEKVVFDAAASIINEQIVGLLPREDPFYTGLANQAKNLVGSRWSKVCAFVTYMRTNYENPLEVAKTMVDVHSPAIRLADSSITVYRASKLIINHKELQTYIGE